MRILSFVTAMMIAGLSAATGLAQDGNGSSKPVIAVVDMGYILKNHPTMKSEMENIETQMAAADQEMNAKKKAIMQKLDQLKEQYTEGTAEYDRAEKSIAEQDTDFRLELVKKRKQFESAQAEVLFNVYNEIQQILEYYAKSTGTQLILRVSREKMDPKKPETIQMVLSQDTLYFGSNTDITDWVLQALQSQKQGQSASKATGTQR